MSEKLINLRTCNNDEFYMPTNLSNLLMDKSESSDDKNRTAELAEFSDIFKHVKNFQSDWAPSIGCEFYDEDFKQHALRRVRAHQCTFTLCDFTGSAANGSDWTGSKFRSCTFDNTNLQFVDFSSCHFETATGQLPTHLLSSNCYGATFAKSMIKDIIINGTTFSNTDFTQATLCDVQVKNSSFEAAKFHYATLTNVNFSNANIEYCDFSNATKNNVTLSLMKFPYVFGVEPAEIESGQIIIQSYFEESGSLKWNQLFELLPQMIRYFQSKSSYFPCANLLLLSNDPRFRNYLNFAMKQNIIHLDVRELKYLARLAHNSKQFSQSELADLYYLIVQAHKSGGEHQQNNWVLHEGEFRKYLLKDDPNQSILFGFTFEGTATTVSQLHCINSITKAVTAAFAIVGVELTCDEVTFSKNSPTKVHFKNCRIDNIENLIINSTDDNDTAQQSKKKDRTIALTIISLVMTTMLQLPTTLKNMRDLEISPTQKSELKECGSILGQSVIIKTMYINEGTDNCLGYDGKTLNGKLVLQSI